MSSVTEELPRTIAHALDRQDPEELSSVLLLVHQSMDNHLDVNLYAEDDCSWEE